MKHSRLLPVPLFAWLVVRTAWISDDAYITFRSIENLIHGYGPVFNVGERVQTFTHPLWFLLQALANIVIGWWADNPFGTGQLYFVNVLLSIALSLIAILVLCLRVAVDTRGAVLGVLILGLSKAFVDYSTSGLENPLTHLLIFCFLALFLTETPRTAYRYFGLALLAGLTGFNRLDVLLLLLPALVLRLRESPHKLQTLGAMLLGLAPLMAWEAFSVFYYGSPFPNTALAKLNTGIDALQLLTQGAYYYLNSLRLDPITLLTIGAALLWSMSRRDASQRVMALGIVLYLAYVLWIGGDFMSGRCFAAPLAVGVALVARTAFTSPRVYGRALALVLILGLAPILLVSQRSPGFGDATRRLYVFVDAHGISDERRFYFEQMGFLKSLAHGAPAGYASADWIYHPQRPARVELVGTLGISGFRYGPDVHVIDRNALADPLLPRMPLQDPHHWRIGHFRHVIPDGYIETLQFGRNLIKDPSIALYYDKLHFVTSGDLWDTARIAEIWNLNTGKYDHLLQNLQPGGAPW